MWGAHWSNLVNTVERSVCEDSTDFVVAMWHYVLITLATCFILML